ncbi:hypothetical protein TRFO_21674 [Tritrichomonas foetus]|uniref:Initiator binding domain-containing protein n=1 Tax=Tritrichomonas foetus TaxID=1144522 RepID=A0A1J4KJ60_9EUKA|nr:hypothetical protein TRFO_21674 [Tritrichomonas foetus]|eukprot:OHT09373.1 hypothetical protein TRFO_21674 [Tritrichomonas foetus]
MEDQSALIPESIQRSPLWSKLTQDEKNEYARLKSHFSLQQKSAIKDRRTVSFASEMNSILSFIESSPNGRENRSLIVGIAYAGPFVCVNTRTLKGFVCRCKSSINGSFQQIGYVSIKNKQKTRICILSLLPSIEKDPATLRQWTVRYAGEDALMCFVPKYLNIPIDELPVIDEEDLFEEKKNVALKPKPNMQYFPQQNMQYSQSYQNLQNYQMRLNMHSNIPNMNHMHQNMQQMQQFNMQMHQQYQMQQNIQQNNFYSNMGMMQQNFQAQSQIGSLPNSNFMQQQQNNSSFFFNSNNNNTNINNSNNAFMNHGMNMNPINHLGMFSNVSNLNNNNSFNHNFNNFKNNNINFNKTNSIKNNHYDHNSNLSSPNISSSSETVRKPVIVSTQTITQPLQLSTSLAPPPLQSIQPKMLDDDLETTFDDPDEESPDPDITQSLSIDFQADLDMWDEINNSFLWDGMPARQIQRSQSAYVTSNAFF